MLTFNVAAAIPILSVDEEKSLGESLFYNEDLDAARKLVLAHLRFVVHIARSYNGYGLPLGDLIQEGNVGLAKAVRRFNPEKGVRLVSFAVHWIKAEIHEFILKKLENSEGCNDKSAEKTFSLIFEAQKELEWLSQDEAKAIANDLDVELKDVMEMEMRLSSTDTAFDLSQDDDEDSSTYSPSVYLASNEIDPAEFVESHDSETDNNLRLKNAIKSLDERSQGYSPKKMVIYKKQTLHELADEYGVSAERIRQLEKNAMLALKRQMQ